MTARRLVHAVARALGDDAPSLAEGFARFEHEGLAVLHGPSAAGPLTPDLAAVEAYAAAIERMHRRETVLPLRYGCLIGSEAEAASMLIRHRGRWLAALDEVEGCDEMGLRVLLDAPPRSNVPAPPSTGTGPDRPGAAYLASLRSRMADEADRSAGADRVTGTIRETLGSLGRRMVVEKPGPGRERLLSLCFLVPRDGSDDFRLAVGRLEGQVPGKILLTGPWPAYNFAGPGPEPGPEADGPL